jgi:hypothetical protein
VLPAVEDDFSGEVAGPVEIRIVIAFVDAVHHEDIAPRRVLDDGGEPGGIAGDGELVLEYRHLAVPLQLSAFELPCRSIDVTVSTESG